MVADTSEHGLESIIVDGLCASGWVEGNSYDYDTAYGIDLVQLRAFLVASQPELADELDLDPSTPGGHKALSRVQGEITRHGIVHALRYGVKHDSRNAQHRITLFNQTPSPRNPAARDQFGANRFTVTRQLHYSSDQARRSLDLALFVNGLPVATFELKNSLTKQTVADAVEQYKRDRDPKELVFGFKRTIAHFAVDDSEVEFCTRLAGKKSVFFPFNRGWNDGAGNPPNPAGLKTSYLWEQVLAPLSLANIVENFAQVVDEERRDGTKTTKQLFPRFHQLDVVRELLADVRQNGAGNRYLIQHSAGSGKSNSIAWLAHQLIGVERAGATGAESPVFDSVVVLTDRRQLDKQITATIRQFMQIGSTVGHADTSSELRKLIESGKKIITTTIQKFPFVLDEIGDHHRDRSFAIIIDEAHSSQGGRTASAVSKALGNAGSGADESGDDGDSIEDLVNDAIENRKMLTNASYFAFTATPKNKTLEMFGDPVAADGATRHKPFHLYSMKQAIEERFILDVLQRYTPVNSYYRLVKTVDGDPEFDVNKTTSKLKAYVEGHETAVARKSEIVVDHFLENVIAQRKIGGRARAMVVTGSIQRAIAYFRAVTGYLNEVGSPVRAIVAFSGMHEYGGDVVSESSLNGFPSSEIEDRIQADPYRFLVCADKFQTGYDEPLLHTMYVDKPLSGVKAVQTLSRLNRSHPDKHDVFVLDFQNDIETIKLAFDDYYRSTILADETDPNKLNDLKVILDEPQIYSPDDLNDFAQRFLTGAARDTLDPLLDVAVARYIEELDESAQVEFKSSAKSFVRTYDFLASILPYGNAEWEKLSMFLTFLVPKLPAPREDDLSKGVLDAIDMDSYRIEKLATAAVRLVDDDALIDPIPISSGGSPSLPLLERLSGIIKNFNDLFGNIEWTDGDRIRNLITDEIPRKVNEDPAYQRAKANSDEQNARVEHDSALERVIVGLLSDDTELFKQFTDNAAFRRWLSTAVFDITYRQRQIVDTSTGEAFIKRMTEDRQLTTEGESALLDLLGRS